MSQHCNENTDREELRNRFRGCLLAGMIGDVAGAVVEGESPGYIKKSYADIDDLLAEDTVPSLFGPAWQVGYYTDDTQMTLAVLEWLLDDEDYTQIELLRKFSAHYEPWRRYGSGAIIILEKFAESEADWQYLSRVVFPTGSFGNGSAMRIAPVGLRFFNNFKTLISTSIQSSMVTHCHPLACQGAVLQSSAVAAAIRMKTLDNAAFLNMLRLSLLQMQKRGQDIEEFQQALNHIEELLKDGASALDAAEVLGNGVAAIEAVPMAIYCFLKNKTSLEQALTDAIFIGGDTDTIACMTGAISGAWLGEQAIPAKWLDKIKEKQFTPDVIRDLAEKLLLTQIHSTTKE